MAQQADSLNPRQTQALLLSSMSDQPVCASLPPGSPLSSGSCLPKPSPYTFLLLSSSRLRANALLPPGVHLPPGSFHQELPAADVGFSMSTSSLSICYKPRIHFQKQNTWHRKSGWPFPASSCANLHSTFPWRAPLSFPLLCIVSWISVKYLFSC